MYGGERLEHWGSRQAEDYGAVQGIWYHRQQAGYRQRSDPIHAEQHRRRAEQQHYRIHHQEDLRRSGHRDSGILQQRAVPKSGAGNPMKKRRAESAVFIRRLTATVVFTAVVVLVFYPVM